MRHSIYRLSSVVLTVALAACDSQPDGPRPPSYPAAVAQTRASAQALIDSGKATALTMALVHRDGVVWTESFGLADQDASVPATTDTMFGIGSVSKMFATVATMQLVERGLVNLDAPLTDYVPGFLMASPGYREITVRMLLDHSSGLPGTTVRGAMTHEPVPSYLDFMLGEVASEHLKAEPGTLAVYCNDGFTLVEALVRSVTGKTYTDYIQQEILTPLGMTHSDFSLATFPDGSWAKAHGPNGNLRQELTQVFASGGLYSTAQDMAVFARALLNGGRLGNATIIAPASLVEMGRDQISGTFDPVPSAYMTFGLGWDTVTEPSLKALGIRAWAKSGGTYQYSTEIVLLPDEGLAAFFSASALIDGEAPLRLTEEALLRALQESGRIAHYPDPLPASAESSLSSPDGLLPHIAGFYANANAVYQLVAPDDGSLRVEKWMAGAWTPAASLLYRRDGWFTSDAEPLTSYRVVDAEDGTQYLATRRPTPDHHALTQMATAQRVSPRSRPLSAAWKARLNKIWLLTNEHPDSELWDVQSDPRITIVEVPGLEGLVATASADGTVSLVDPAAGDALASMMVRIPSNSGRDLADLEVLTRDGEEWLRLGSFRYRPQDEVPVLASDASSTVAIGSEGWGEWRKVTGGSQPVTVSFDAGEWKLFGPDFALIGRGNGKGAATLTAGSTEGWVLLDGSPGQSLAVTVQ